MASELRFHHGAGVKLILVNSPMLEKQEKPHVRLKDLQITGL